MFRTTLLSAIFTVATSTAAIAQGPVPPTPAPAQQQELKTVPVTPP